MNSPIWHTIRNYLREEESYRWWRSSIPFRARGIIQGKLPISSELVDAM
jgi:hypothetical protein